VAEILRSAPSIAELGIIIDRPTSSIDVDKLMNLFTASDIEASTPVAPHLSSMFFGCDKNSYMDYKVYLKMVQSCWRSRDCALRSVALLTVAGSGPDQETLDALSALREEGLEVFVL
jgi:hypothetical protein